MVDRVVETSITEVPEIAPELEKVLLFALNEAHTLVDGGEDVIPFTAIVVKENVFIERHPGDTPEQCFASARHTVENLRGAVSYAFCYDGYVDTDNGIVDALIAEGGLPGEPTGYALALVYTIDDEGKYHFESEVNYIGEAPNFMSHTLGPMPVEETNDAEEAVDEALEGDDGSEDEAIAASPYELDDANAEDFPTIAELEARQNEE